MRDDWRQAELRMTVTGAAIAGSLGALRIAREMVDERAHRPTAGPRGGRYLLEHGPVRICDEAGDFGDVVLRARVWSRYVRPGRR